MNSNKRTLETLKETFYPGYSDFEINAIKLVEMRGVAVYGNDDVIYDIVDYCNNFIKDEYPKIKEKYQNVTLRKTGEEVKYYKSYEIKIPYELTNKFNEFHNLNLIIRVKDIIGKHLPPKSYGRGETILKKNNTLDSNKRLIDCTIEIECYSLNNKISYYHFSEVFNHEYNHALEQKRRELSKSKNETSVSSFNDYKKKNVDLRVKWVDDDDEIKKSFGWILYILWNKTEFNAWVTSGYSHLKSINSKRENFSEDIKDSEIYEIYSLLKNIYIPNIKNCKSISRWVYVYNIINKNKISTDFVERDELIKKLQTFKKSFIKRTEMLIDKFWIKICRTASLWYEEKNELDKGKKNK